MTVQDLIDMLTELPASTRDATCVVVYRDPDDERVEGTIDIHYRYGEVIIEVTPS